MYCSRPRNVYFLDRVYTAPLIHLHNETCAEMRAPAALTSSSLIHIALCVRLSVSQSVSQSVSYIAIPSTGPIISAYEHLLPFYQRLFCIMDYIFIGHLSCNYFFCIISIIWMGRDLACVFNHSQTYVRTSICCMCTTNNIFMGKMFYQVIID